MLLNQLDLTAPPSYYTLSICPESSHFGFLSLPLPELFEYEESIITDLPISWLRLVAGPFVWNIVESVKGNYDFSVTDDRVKDAQSKGLYILPTIWPFAEWDQNYWKQQTNWRETPGEFSEFGIPRSRYKPHDMEAYKQFIEAMVERYDGDGKDDMPNLRYPIKYWEVANEPSHDAYFLGTTKDYFDVLKATYEAVKSADPEAKVLVGAPAPEQESKFWNELIDLGGGEYFDIANIHQVPSEIESSAIFINDILSEYGFEKPIWVTESGNPFAKDEDKQAENLVKGYVAGFSNGVERVFYNLYKTFPMIEGKEKISGQALIDKGRKKPIYYAMHTIIEKLDCFTSVKKLSDGQYKFIVESRSIYVLWGNESIPPEITGTVTVTSINGQSQRMDVEDIVLTDTPIFVEVENYEE